MPLIVPMENSSASGEVSPDIYARTDLDKYKSALRTARNFIMHAQGGASNRCGMNFIATVKYATFSSATIAQEFIFSQTQAYTLEFGHRYVRFYRDGMQIQNNGIPYEVVTPYLESDLRNLRFRSSADVIYITNQSYQQRTLSRFGEKDWRLAAYTSDDGPFMPENIDETVSLTASSTTGTSTLTLSATSAVNSNIIVLLHGNGVDASTTITDTTNRHIWTAAGNAQVDTADFVFATGSLLFDGAGDYISTPDHADFFLGTSDWTIEFRFKTTSLATVQSLYYQKTDANNRVQLYYGGGRLILEVLSAGVTVISSYMTDTPITDTSWHDYAVIRSGNVIYFFMDGISLSVTNDVVIGTTSIPNLTGNVLIGSEDTSAKFLTGWLDEYLITRSALYTADYTISSSEFSTLTTSAGSFAFDPLHVGALFKLRHYVEGQTIAQAFTGTGTSSSIKCFTTWRLITHGTWAAKFNVEKSLDNGTTWTVLRGFSGSSDFNANTSGTEDIDTNPVPFLVRINVTTYTSGTLNVDLTTDPFFQDGIARVTSFNSPISVVSTVLQTIGSTLATSTWSEGSWSDYRGYPAVSQFFQDRLDFAATPSEPQTDWLSKTSNYTSFVRNSPLLDIDGITINLPSRQLNAINGLIAFKKLLALTSSSIWSIGAISGTALTPSSVQQDVEQYSGSAGLEPAVIEDEAIYVDAGGEIVRNIGFQLAVDGFKGDETNILAKHLFEGYTILDMAYQRSPNSILWIVRSDGVLLSLTYMRDQNVIAWAHHDTDGLVESICVTPSKGSEVLSLVVDRDNSKNMEQLVGRKQHDLTGHVFLDAYVHYDNSSYTLSTLTHLANQVVSLVGDAVDLGTMTVSSAGTLAMSSRYSSLDVGLSYNSDYEKLNMDIPLQGSTLQGSQIKVGNVTFRLINTRGGYIGPNSSTLYEAFTYETLNRANQLINKVSLGVTENFNGDVKVPLGAGYENGGRIFYRQARPFPVTISGVIPEFTPGGKVS